MTATQAIERTREVIRRQHKALSTEHSYIHWLRRYMNALPHMPPELSSEKKLEHFLTSLARVHDVSASTQNQAFNALLFFYQHVLGQPLGNIHSLRATRPTHERHAPTVSETQALLQSIRNYGGYPTNLVARLLYGCGLRVCEPLNLRIKDIDLERRCLWIRGAKGGKDRAVTLPNSLIPELTQQIQLARITWQRDRQDRIPLILPHRLARKYPEYQFSWGWAWLFPAHQPCRDPRSGTIVRYRMHEANVQRAVRYAARKLEICVLPHELRHAFASHCLYRGANPRAIQQAMGHASLETTMGYLHAEALSVTSPLDALPLITPVLPSNSGESATPRPAIPNPSRFSQKPGVQAPASDITHVPRLRAPAWNQKTPTTNGIPRGNPSSSQARRLPQASRLTQFGRVSTLPPAAKRPEPPFPPTEIDATLRARQFAPDSNPGASLRSSYHQGGSSLNFPAYPTASRAPIAPRHQP